MSRKKRRNEYRPVYENLEIRWLMRGGESPWATFAWLSHLQAAGDHRFDRLYHKLEARLANRWHRRHHGGLPIPSVNPPATALPDRTTGTSAGIHVPPTATTAPTPTTPTPTPSPTPTSPIPVYQDNVSIAVGSTLDVAIPGHGPSGPDLTYTISPQPLPSHMTFNRQTGELVFVPSPDQVGNLSFSILASDGSSKARTDLTIAVTSTAGPGIRAETNGIDPTATTSLSGRVVDETGAALADMPVTVGGVTTTTDSDGHFTLDGVATAAAPLSAGGNIATLQDRLALMAPIADLLGHDLYAGVDNVIAAPLILPAIAWSSPATIAPPADAQPVDVTDPSVPGFDIQLPAGSTAGSGGSVSLATLSADLSAQHMPDGIRSGMLLTKVTGVDVSGPVKLTLPNDQGYQPGSVLGLYLINMQTGGHDLAGLMEVSADGKTMTSIGSVTLAKPKSGDESDEADAIRTFDVSPGNTQFCVMVGPAAPPSNPDSPCAGCQPTANDTGSFPNLDPMRPQLASDAGLVTGEYFQDHQLVTYQSQGQSRGIDLQYSSLQAYGKPVVQYQFTTPIAGSSATITSITAQVTLAGVVQGSATTYTPPSGFADQTTYNIPLQVDASSLATGVYTYVMTVSEVFGSGAGATTITTTNQGVLNVVNATSTPLGAGWSVGGLEQLAQLSPGGPVLITAGQQGTEHFDPVYSNGQTSLQDLAFISGPSTAQVLTNDGTGGFTFSGTPSTTGFAPSVTADFNADGKPDLAILSNSTLSIFLNNGSGGFTAGSTYTMPSGQRGVAIAIGNFIGHTNGAVDIAVQLNPTAMFGAYKVGIYSGNNDGTFATPVLTTILSDMSTGGGTVFTAADFNGDGKDDLALVVRNTFYEMLAGTGGAMGSPSGVTLPTGVSGVLAAVALDYNGDGKQDLVVEAGDGLADGGGSFPCLALLQGNGSGGFTAISTFQLDAHPPGLAMHGLVVGAFQGAAKGLEVAVPMLGDGLPVGPEFIDIVPLSSSGTWGTDIMHPLGNSTGVSYTGDFDIVAADFNGSGKPSIAVSDGTGRVYLLLADPDSDQFFPIQSLTLTTSGGFWGLAAAPFAGNAATAGYRGPSSDPSTLVHNVGGTWTRTYPDGTVVQFNASGQETSIADRNGNATSFSYVSSGAAAGALQTITDPVGLVTTLTYSSGKLATVTDPANRVTTVVVDGNGNLTTITDPDGAVSQFGYSTPSNHLITTEVNPDSKTATAHYNSFGQLTSETLFDGTSSTGVVGAQGQGLLAPGGSGSLPLTFQGSVTDPDGHTTTLTFNWMSHPVVATDADGGLTTTIYNRQGFPVVVTDPLGRTTSYAFDARGNVTQITRPDGTTYKVAYDPTYSQPTQVTDFNGNTTTYTLDAHGNVTRRTDPDLNHEDWTYNSAGQVLTDTDRNGNTTTYSYNSLGRVTTITYPGTGAPTAKLAYDSAGNVASETDELGHTTSYTYDQAGRILTSADPLQYAAGKPVTYTYDPAGNLTAVTDSNNHTTSYLYDARDRLVGVVDPVNQGTGRSTTYAYDAASNLIGETDPLGHATTFAFDRLNRQTGTTDADGHRTTWTYDADGEMTSMTDPNGHTTTYVYNNVGRMTAEVLPGLLTYTYNYDGNGNLTKVTDPLGHATTYLFDALDRETSATDALNHRTTFSYDNNGNLTAVIDALNHTTTYNYDVRNREVNEIDPSGGGTTTLTYDAAGDLTGVKDPVGNLTVYSYDSANRVTTVSDPAGHKTTYSYDLMGNVTGKTDRSGRVYQYGYDADDRETTEKWIAVGGGTLLRTITYTYDAAGRLTQAQDAVSKYAYTYDNANRLLTVDDGGTVGLPRVTLTYGYDNAGNVSSVDDSLGGLTSYAYDVRDEVVSITQSGTGVAAKRVDLAYDNAQRLTTITRYSDLAGSSSVLITGYGYDNADRLTGITDKTSGGTTRVSYAYTYDAANRVTTEVRTWASGASTDTLGYTYTNNNQLTGVTHTNGSFTGETFSYDANGNRNSTGYVTGSDNQLTTDGTYNYAYISAGDEVSRTEISSGNKTLYVYDYHDRLIEVDSVVGGVTTVLATYTYDVFDRRIGRKEGSTTTWTLYDGSNPILDFNASKTQTARYLQGVAAVDVVLARETSGGAVAWYLPDRLDTVRDLVDNSGAVIDHVDYDAYGNVLGESAPAAGDRLVGSTGLERDTAIGLDLAIFRVKDPNTGRWTTQDPIAFDGGDPNLYRYVGNDPIGAVDPIGDEKIEIIYSPLGPGGHHHGTVVVTDPGTGNKTFYRGGPGTNPLGGGSSESSGGSSGSSGGSSSGSSSGSSGSNSSNSSNSSSPGSSPGRPGGRTGWFGPVKCVYGPYVPGSIDYPKDGDPSQLPSVTVVDNPNPAGPTNKKLRQIFDGYNDRNSPYNPLSNNSNTAAHQACEDLGHPRPTPPVWAPAWDRRLR